MKKRILSILLVLSMVFTLIPAFAVTASAEVTTDNYTIVLKGGKAYKDSVTDINIITPEGLTYDNTKGEWMMNNFVFATSATVGIKIEDEGDVTINVSGTNSITVGLGDSKDNYGISAVYSVEEVEQEFVFSGTALTIKGNSTSDKLTVDSHAAVDKGNMGIQAYSLAVDTLQLDIEAGYENGGGNSAVGIDAFSVAVNDAIININARDYQSNGITYIDTLDVTGASSLTMSASGKPIERTTDFVGNDPNAIAKSDETTLNWSSELGTYLKSDNPLDAYYGKLTLTAFACQITECASAPDLVGKKYGTVTDALTAASTNATTIQLIRNVSENVVISGDFNNDSDTTPNDEQNITLDLNGYVLKSSELGSVITNKGKLKIIDSNTSNQSHKFKVGSNGLWTLNDSTEDMPISYENLTARPSANDLIAIKGGCITGGRGASGGGINNGNNGDLTITGGNIVGNTCSSSGGSGIKSTTGTTLTITGGNIVGNAFSDLSAGGAVLFNGSSFDFSGGEISFNHSEGIGGGIQIGSCNTITIRGNAKVRYNYASVSGGGIVIVNDCKLNLYSGEITGNSCAGNFDGGGNGNGGGIAVFMGEITLGGDVRITGNTLKGKENNVYLASGKAISISGTPNAPVSGTSGMKVGVSMANQTGQFTTNGIATDVQYFTSDNDKYVVKFVKGDTTKEATEPLYKDHLELVNAYSVTEATCTKGSVSVGTTKKYAEGDEVTITNTPDNGYELDEYSVYKTDEQTTTVAVIDGKFTMPAYDVTVSATFKEKLNPTPTPAPAKKAFIARGTAKGSTNTIKWNAVEGADGYEVYFAKCGSKSYKKVKSTAALKYTKKKLNKKYIYKYIVKAYKKVDGKKTYIATAPTVHIAGSKAKYSNAIKLTVNKTKLSLAIGETSKIRGKIAKKSNSKSILWKGHVSAKIRYMSTDKSVVTVDKSGNIKAVGQGEAYIYVYAANGVNAKVKISVNGGLGAVWIG